jgi:type IV pilus assembly protein PilO
MALEKSFAKMKWHYQVLIVSAICGGVLGLVWYQFLAPMQEQIVAKKGQIQELEVQVARSTAQKLVFEKFKAESMELAKRLELLKTVLPLEKETDQILRTIQAGVATSGLRPIRYNLRSVVDHEVFTEWPWDMEIVGTYHNIERFLDKIRQLPRIVNISNLRVTGRNPEGEQAFTASVGATFVATTFIYHEEPIATAPPPPKPAR